MKRNTSARALALALALAAACCGCGGEYLGSEPVVEEDPISVSGQDAVAAAIAADDARAVDYTLRQTGAMGEPGPAELTMQQAANLADRTFTGLSGERAGGDRLVMGYTPADDYGDGRGRFDACISGGAAAADPGQREFFCEIDAITGKVQRIEWQGIERGWESLGTTFGIDPALVEKAYGSAPEDLPDGWDAGYTAAVAEMNAWLDDGAAEYVQRAGTLLVGEELRWEYNGFRWPERFHGLIRQVQAVGEGDVEATLGTIPLPVFSARTASGGVWLIFLGGPDRHLTSFGMVEAAEVGLDAQGEVEANEMGPDAQGEGKEVTVWYSPDGSVRISQRADGSVWNDDGVQVDAEGKPLK